ncbi:MAG: prepilin-type N-terminal cleavage/methylation domain-containing protein [Leptolyngbyaceae cyanobacterium SL_7_1]|nr:prepilin-type N-terminal cleavage/methylation domain-containing protein [Leptolyngbyaceae cyanobacterium SL_7_1]
MAKRSILFKLKQVWFSRRKRRSSNAGFTLLELLVVTIIAGGIVAGLTYIAVELLGTDQRESARTETQRDMQLALNFIANDLQEAVYVYDAQCMVGAAGVCPGILNYIPTALRTNGSVPVLAFWKQQPIPSTFTEAGGECGAGYDPAADPPELGGAPIPCVNANSYALIVYSLKKSDGNNDVWRGRARITRYALTEFQQDGSRTPGYSNPAASGSATLIQGFVSWPFGTTTANPGVTVNLQAPTPPPGPNAQVLVDFVDDGQGASEQRPPIPTATGAQLCDPTGTGQYTITPPDSIYAGFSALPRSFYACVSGGAATVNPVTGQTVTANQDVVLFLRGNAVGRGGVFNNASFLPTLRTQVMSRGILDKLPQ